MKNFLLAISLTLAIGTIFTLNSCKKTSTEDDSVSAKDENSISNGVNATSDDAAAAAGQVQSFSGKTEGMWWSSAVLCGASIVDTPATNGTGIITITYDGTTTCNGVIRTGTISIQRVGTTLWKQQGGELTVTFNNLKFTDVTTQATYTVNGTHTITNKTGGLAWQVVAQIVPSGTTVTHRNQSSNMSITFPDGSMRTWNVDRDRSWNLTGQTITVTVSSENSGSVDVWGTNRYGNTFTNAITQPVSADNNPNCEWRPYTGTITHQVANRSVTVVFGTNALGVQVGTPTVCAGGYYVTYQHNNRTAYLFVPYW